MVTYRELWCPKTHRPAYLWWRQNVLDDSGCKTYRRCSWKSTHAWLMCSSAYSNIIRTVAAIGQQPSRWYTLQHASCRGLKSCASCTGGGGAHAVQGAPAAAPPMPLLGMHLLLRPRYTEGSDDSDGLPFSLQKGFQVIAHTLLVLVRSFLQLLLSRGLLLMESAKHDQERIQRAADET